MGNITSSETAKEKMGAITDCMTRKKVPPPKIYHPINQPCTRLEDQIYEVLEFWFCTDYTIEEKVDHVKDITPIKIAPMGDRSDKKYEV